MNLATDLNLAKSGDRAALDRVLAGVQPKLRRITEKRVGVGLRGEVAPSDILQSTYLEIIRGVSNFEGQTEDAFVAWIAQILENNIRQKKRFYDAQKRKRPDLERIDEEDLIGRSKTPVSDARRLEDLLVVGRALDDLSEEHRRVIMMKVVDGKTHEEIAEVLGKTTAATKMLLARARAALALAVERA